MKHVKVNRLQFYALMCLCLVGAIGLGIGITYRTEQSAEYFSNQLRAYGLRENVSFGNETYEISGGEVSRNGAPVSGHTADAALRLAYEKVAARVHPFLAIPGIDPQALKESLVSLQDVSSELAARQTDPTKAELVRDDLYPIDFLRAAADLESARLEFLRTGSLSSATDYEQAQKRTLDAYLSGLDAFANAFATAVSPEALSFATEKDVISRADVLRAIRTLKERAHEIGRKMSERASCIRGNLNLCFPADTSLPKLPEGAGTLPSRALRIEQSVRDLYSQAGYTIPDEEPLVLLSKSACVNAQPGTALLFGFERMPSAEAPLAPFFFGDIRYIDSSKYSSRQFFKYFFDSGVHYVLNRHLTNYGCPEISTDVGAVNSVRAIRTFALQEKVSRFVPAPDQPVLRALEAGFSTNKVVKEEDAMTYMRFSETYISSAGMPTALSYRMLELALEAEEKTLGLYPLVEHINFYERNNMLIAEKGLEGLEMDFDASYLFFVRSSIPSFFLSANPSFGAPVQLFKENHLPSSEEPYIYYSSLFPTTGILHDELLRDMTIYRSLHLGR
jgi:hypothetical protein